MRREAHFIENEFVKGEWTDELAYAILAPEWRALRGPAPEIQFYGSSPSKGDALRAD
jgi:hypothetical protein